jgi:hypothetical protein
LKTGFAEEEAPRTMPAKYPPAERVKCPSDLVETIASASTASQQTQKLWEVIVVSKIEAFVLGIMMAYTTPSLILLALLLLYNFDANARLSFDRDAPTEQFDRNPD